MSPRRLAVFVVINAVVSAIVVLIVLNVWDSSRSTPAPIPTLAPTINNIPIAVQPIGPTATPIGPLSYVIQSGDTLLSISEQFDISLAALLSANHLQANDILNIGQTLIIPGGEPVVDVAPTTPTATVIALSTSTPAPEVTSSVGGLLVTIRQIDGSGLLGTEALVLINLGDKVNLSDWTLSDGDGHKFTFPDLTLLPNAEVRIHTIAGTDTSTDLFWGQSTALWGGSGVIAYLRDPSGKLMATYRVP